MADVPQAPLEGSSSTSSDEKAILFMTEDDGASGLRAALFKATASSVVNGQRLGVLSVDVEDGVQGADAEDAAVSGNPVLSGGRYDSTARTLDNGDVGALAVDDAGRIAVVGAVEEDAAVDGGPVLIGGRYNDLTIPISVNDGDAVIAAMNDDGKLLTAPYLIDDSITYTTNTSVTVGSTSTQVIAANSNRVGLIITNDSTQTIYLALGAVATMNSGIRINASGGSYEITWANIYQGSVYAISASGSANLCVTEVEVY